MWSSRGVGAVLRYRAPVHQPHRVSADASVQRLFGWVLLASLLHQPLTLLLVYGDRHQFAQCRRLYVLMPLVAVVLVGVAVLLDLWVIVPIAAVWQTVHTLQQRYGLLCIYARKSGYGGPGLDRAVLFVPFLAIVALVALLQSPPARWPASAVSSARTQLTKSACSPRPDRR